MGNVYTFIGFCALEPNLYLNCKNRMVYWKSWSFNVKFSLIAFFTTAVLSLISMGALGALLYYPVSFLFGSNPNLMDWGGDWVWPSVIMVGMLWSFGFVFGAVAWYYIQKITQSKALLIAAYLLILWLWAALLWCWMIKVNLDQMSQVH
ncbi:hypothetical protein SAMN03080602_03247 [Arenibacter troitsensis]|uniref:Uncharacterized protein n=2 Tax=Arenibacter troitsensis TaxID=188872 RepID=A0A1X7KSH9_9FLAO|nr:hypothetical protein SAMN03080602_03247 [Arenibacter troitsensis]